MCTKKQFCKFTKKQMSKISAVNNIFFWPHTEVRRKLNQWDMIPKLFAGSFKGCKVNIVVENEYFRAK